MILPLNTTSQFTLLTNSSENDYVHARKKKKKKRKKKKNKVSQLDTQQNRELWLR